MKTYTAVIGPKDVASIFGAVGVRVLPADDSETVLALLQNLQKESKDPDSETCSIVFVLDSLLSSIPFEEYQKLIRSPFPAIIPVPGFDGPSGFSEQKIQHIVQQAIGSDIFSD